MTYQIIAGEDGVMQSHPTYYKGVDKLGATIIACALSIAYNNQVRMSDATNYEEKTGLTDWVGKGTFITPDIAKGILQKLLNNE